MFFFCEESATCCDRFQSADEGPICELCSQPVLRVISQGAGSHVLGLDTKHNMHELVLYMKHFDSFHMQTNTGYLDDWRICATLAATYLEVQFVPLPGWSWTQKGKKTGVNMTLDLNMLGKAHNPLVLNIVFPIKVAICGYSPFSDKPSYLHTSRGPRMTDITKTEDECFEVRMCIYIYYILLYYIILYHIILYYIMLYYNYVILYYVILYYIILYYIIL